VRVVLDTNVVASALVWGGVPHQLLQAARAKRLHLFTSTPLLIELADVLARRKFAPKLAAIRFTIDEVIERYAELNTIVRPVSIARIAPDPDDDVVLATALAARAAIVVTGDKGLLGIEQYQGVKIVSVIEVARKIAE